MFRARYLTFFWLIYFGILIQQICFHVVKGRVVLSPSPAIAIDGESFTFTCTYSGNETVAGFIWSLNGNTLAVLVLPNCTPFANPGPPDSSQYKYTCRSSEQSTFTVKLISNQNNGDSWQCAAAAPRYIHSDIVNITVQVPVSNVSLTPPSGSITENFETSFTCETSVSRPEATIAWYKESFSGQKLEITSNISSTTEDVGVLIKSKSVVKYRPSRGDNGYKIYCEAVNILGRTPIESSKFQMNVLYTPDGPPQIQNVSNGRIHQVIENNQGRLVCIINGGNPLATLTWSCFNTGLATVTTGTTVTKTVTWNATRGSDRSCTCQTSNPVAGTQSVSVKVQILYMAVVTSFGVRQNHSQNLPLPITVNENARVEFECTVDSNPGSTIEIQKEDRQLKREEHTKTLTFSIPLSTCFDTGVYTCSSRNQYNLEKSSEKKLSLFVRCSPRPLINVKENVTGADRYPATLTFKGIAYPAPRFTWMKKEGGDWRTLSNSSHFSILISGVDTNLTINKVSISDYGEYLLKIENEIDFFIQPYYLTEEKVPEIPSDFHVVEEHISDTFALLRWKPGFNGGINQTFILMYKRSLDQNWMRKTVLDTQEGLVIYTLHDLISNSEYTVVLFARNQAGDSISSQNITFSTKERRKEISKETSSANGGGVIGGIVGGIVVLCILVIAVLFYLYRRNIISCKGPLKETSNKSLTGEQGDYSEMNTSYLNASHVYDSLQTELGVTADLSNQSVYMRLDKGNNDKDKNVYTELGVTADLSNQSVYMRLDKSNNEKDKNVYTELERQPDHTEGKKVYANME